MKLTREELEKYVRDAYGEPLRDATHDFFNELMPGSNRVVCTQNIADAAKTLIRTIIDAAIGRFDALTDSTGGGEKPEGDAVERAAQAARSEFYKTWDNKACEKLDDVPDDVRERWLKIAKAALEAARPEAEKPKVMTEKEFSKSDFPYPSEPDDEESAKNQAVKCPICGGSKCTETRCEWAATGGKRDAKNQADGLLNTEPIGMAAKAEHRRHEAAKNQADGEESHPCKSEGASDASPSALEEREYEVKVEESNSILQGRHGIVFDRALADERNAASKLIEKLKQRNAELERDASDWPACEDELKKQRDSARAEAISAAISCVYGFWSPSGFTQETDLKNCIAALEAMKAPK